MNELETHIKEQNDKTRQWVAEDPKNRWAALPVENKEHWNSLGIHTPEQYDHYCLVCDVFELTRSAFGYKPSWAGLDGMTNEELQAEAKFLGEECKRQMEAERNEELAHEKAVKEALTPKAWTIGDLIKI